MMTKHSEQQSRTSMNFGTWGWIMIIYCVFMYFNYAGWSADGLNIFTTAFGNAHGWDPAVLLSLATPAGLVGVLGTFIFGQVIIKKGARFVFVFSLLVMALLTVWFGRVSSLWEFGIVLALINFFSAGYGFIAPGTLITNWFPTKKGLALGWATMGMPLSTALFVPLIAFLFGALGIANATTAFSGFILLLALIGFFLIKNSPEQIGVSPDNGNFTTEELQANLKELESHVSPFTIKRLLKDREMWLISIGFGALWLVTVGIVVQLVPRLISIGYSQNSAIASLPSFSLEWDLAVSRI